MTWEQQEPKRSERWLSAALILGFVVVLAGLAYVISNRSAPEDDGRATGTTKVQATTTAAPPSSSSTPETTTLAPTTAPETTTTQPSTTTTQPTTTTGPKPAEPVSAQPDGLFCRDLKAKGYDFAAALAYWNAHGRPARMDADGNGIPCQTVWPPG